MLVSVLKSCSWMQVWAAKGLSLLEADRVNLNLASEGTPTQTADVIRASPEYSFVKITSI